MRHTLARFLIVAAAGAVLCSDTAVAEGVRIDIGLGTPSGPPVVLTTSPQLVVVPGTSVYYAPEVPVDYFRYQGRYYSVVNDVWSTAAAYHGPWVTIQIGQVPRPVRSVPVDYYKIPPGWCIREVPPRI
jgi:hypothetical protein